MIDAFQMQIDVTNELAVIFDDSPSFLSERFDGGRHVFEDICVGYTLVVCCFSVDTESVRQNEIIFVAFI